MTSPQSQGTNAPINSTTARSADVFDQLQRAVADLGSQLQPSTNPDMVGRDTAEIRELFNRIYGYERQLAQLLNVSWTPSWPDRAA